MVTGTRTGLSRRTLLHGGSLSIVTALAACAGREESDAGGTPAPRPSAEQSQGRLAFRPPSAPAAAARRRGRFDLDVAGAVKLAAVYVPPDADREDLRLVVMLHGAGGRAGSALDILRDEADAGNLLLVAPQSTGRTWDVLTGGFGPDVRTIDRLLHRLAASYRVRGYTVGGFSDGASYALSLGLVNGDVFDTVIAFSPGFTASTTEHGRPRLFISHGTQDRVLPIDRCSRRIVPAVQQAGYDVTYREFPGGHAVPWQVQQAAVDWLTG